MGGTQKKLTKGYTSDPRRWVGVNVKEKRVVKVVWKRKGLSGAIADFSTLTALTWLDLSYNSLTSIDAGIGSLHMRARLLSLFCNEREELSKASVT